MIPYVALADMIRSQQAIFFLGAASSSVGASTNKPLPIGRAFSRTLARDTSYPGADDENLPKVAQYADEVSVGRLYLLSLISKIFHLEVDQDYTTSFLRFLDGLPIPQIPRLIITTNYDTTIEKTLDRRGVRYIAFGHLLSRERKFKGRLFSYSSIVDESDFQIIPRSKLNDQIESIAGSDSDVVLLYKMHGTAVHLLSSDGEAICDPIVLTENDYINFLEANLLREIPTEVMTMMRKKAIVFFGYSLEDWNFRVLLSRIRNLQQLNIRNWACLTGADPVDKAFWDKRGVNIAEIDLGEFTEELLLKIKSANAS